MRFFLPILNWYDTIHPFFQNLCAAAAFAFIFWLLRKITSKVSTSSSNFFTAYQRMELLRHFIHKELINSDHIVKFSKGYFIATLEAFRWALRGILIFVFFLGVDAINHRNWWLLLGYWFLLNCMLEAYQTLKDKSSENEISYIKQEIKDEVRAMLYPDNTENNDEPNQQIKRTENSCVLPEKQNQN